MVIIPLPRDGHTPLRIDSYVISISFIIWIFIVGIFINIIIFYIRGIIDI